jgi:hypothetical protein
LRKVGTASPEASIGNAARTTAQGEITEAGNAIGDDPDSGFENALWIAVLPDADGTGLPDPGSPCTSTARSTDVQPHCASLADSDASGPALLLVGPQLLQTGATFLR